MPELPEVETTRRGILPHIRNQTVTEVKIHNRQLRWPIPKTLKRDLIGQQVKDIERRAKYLLIKTDAGTLILHLGMSGSLHITDCGKTIRNHDHLEICFDNNKVLRLNDPRRFGCALWIRTDPMQHKLIKSLGPEPLDEDFTAEYLYRISRNRKVAVKNLIMNSQIVVGVGNIYASEALFLAGIRPSRAAGKVSRARYKLLTNTIKQVLNDAIDAGGSSLRDFTSPDGKAGYFQHHFRVYGKTGEPCEQCGTLIKQVTLGQRSTFYCDNCQT